MITIIHLSDLHIHGKASKPDNQNAVCLVDYLLAKYGHMAKRETFVVLTGDLVDDAALKQYRNLKRVVLDRLGARFTLLAAPGNHDYAWKGNIFTPKGPKRFKAYVDSRQYPIVSPVKLGERWLVDGGIVNPVPVSPCRALGAEIVVAINLNGDLVHKHTAGGPESQAEAAGPQQGPQQPPELLERLMSDIPSVIRDGAGAIAERILRAEADNPKYFDVIFGSINIMQDHITRSRMAGDPPDVMLTPRLNDIGLLEFSQADRAIEEGRRSVLRMLPALKDALGLST